MYCCVGILVLLLTPQPPWVCPVASGSFGTQILLVLWVAAFAPTGQCCQFDVSRSQRRIYNRKVSEETLREAAKQGCTLEVGGRRKEKPADYCLGPKNATSAMYH